MNSTHRYSEDGVHNQYDTEIKGNPPFETAYSYVEIIIGLGLHSGVSVVGVVTNILNMVIFSKMGIKDSNGVGLIALSFTDFLVTFLQLAMCICRVINLLCPQSSFDVEALRLQYFSWTQHVIYFVSCWITTAISIERCFCVVFPFKVKQIFTKARCVVTITVIYVVHIGLHVPVYMTQWWAWQEVAAQGEGTSGELMMTVVFADNRMNVELVVDIVDGLVLSIMSQLIIVICTVWMIYGLQATSKVRQKKTTGVHELRTEESKVRSRASKSNTGKRESNLSAGERKFVKIALGLSVMLAFCNLPGLLCTIAYQAKGGLDNGEDFQIMRLTLEITNFLNTWCCSVNFLVYLKLNSNYRQILESYIRDSLAFLAKWIAKRDK